SRKRPRKPAATRNRTRKTRPSSRVFLFPGAPYLFACRGRHLLPGKRRPPERTGLPVLSAAVSSNVAEFLERIAALAVLRAGGWRMRPGRIAWIVYRTATVTHGVRDGVG